MNKLDEQIAEGAKPASSAVDKKKRKTLDEYLGINGLLVVAIIGAIFRGGILSAMGTVCGLSAVYYLFKKRKVIEKNQKYIGWGLMTLWLIIFGLLNQS